MVMFGAFERAFLATESLMSNTIFFLFTVLGFFLFANLMIAMFGSTYTKIEEESYTFWATNRAHLVISLINRPYIPPLNIVEVMFKMIGWVTSKCKPKNKSVDSRRRQVDRMLQRLPTRKRLHVKQLIEGNQSTMPPCLCHHAYATMPMHMYMEMYTLAGKDEDNVKQLPEKSQSSKFDGRHNEAIAIPTPTAASQAT